MAKDNKSIASLLDEEATASTANEIAETTQVETTESSDVQIKVDLASEQKISRGKITDPTTGEVTIGKLEHPFYRYKVANPELVDPNAPNIYTDETGVLWLTSNYEVLDERPFVLSKSGFYNQIRVVNLTEKKHKKSLSELTQQAREWLESNGMEINLPNLKDAMEIVKSL